MEILTAIVAGLFALVGAYLGGVLNRKTQRQNWLLQKRAESFEKLWEALESSRSQAAQYLRSTSDIPLIQGQKALDLFQPAFTQARVARLFASENTRTKLAELVNDLYALTAIPDLGTERFKAMKDDLDALQQLMETDLKSVE